MPTILPDPVRLHLDHIGLDANVITLVVASKEKVAPRPLFGTPPGRVHSRSVQTLANLPRNGVARRLPPFKLRLSLPARSQQDAALLGGKQGRRDVGDTDGPAGECQPIGADGLSLLLRLAPQRPLSSGRCLTDQAKGDQVSGKLPATAFSTVAR